MRIHGINLVTPQGVEDVKIGQAPLDPSKRYRFTIPSYNAAGGDGYPKISEHHGYVDTGFVDADVLKEFLEKHSPIDVNAFNDQGEMVYTTALSD